MTRILVAMSCALLLAACDEEKEKAEINRTLPAGCVFRDLGRYSGMDVVAVICDRRPTTTTTYKWRAGRVTHHAASLSIEAAQ